MVKPLLDGLDRARRLLRFCGSGEFPCAAAVRSDLRVRIRREADGIGKFPHLTSTEASVISPGGRDCRG
jgi:hypothetical protein